MLARGFIKELDREPTIEGFEFYLDAFRELSTSRPTGLEMGAIPFTAIADYFRIYELQDFDEFAYVIRQMDDTLLELNYESRKNDKGGNNGTSNPNAKNHNQRRR